MRRAALPLIVFVVLVGGLLVTGCANLGQRMVEGHYRRQLSRADLTVEQVEVAGHQIAYVEGGVPEGEGEVVVMVHGFTGDKTNWYAFARHLARGYHLYALDLPPFGESPEVEGTVYTITGHVERLTAFLEAVGVKKAHLVGNSMGGHTVALYALAHPERVASLALFDSAGVTSPEKSEAQRIGESGVNPLAVDTKEDLDRVLRLSFVDPPFVPRAARNYVFEQRRARGDQTRRLLEAYFDHWVPLEPDLSRIEVPTLVLWGDRDLITHPSAVGVFAEGLPNETVVIMKACGHVPMMERPKETAMHYLDFLKRAGAP